MCWISEDGLERKFTDTRGEEHGTKLFNKSIGRHNGRPKGYPASAVLKEDILGMWGEITVADYYKIGNPCQLDGFSRPDVGGIQVKTRSYPTADLWVKHGGRGEPDYPVMLVVKLGDRHFKIVGWIMRKEALKFETTVAYGSGDHISIVPQSALKHPNELPEKYVRGQPRDD